MTNKDKSLPRRNLIRWQFLEGKAFYLGAAFLAVPLITYFVMSGAFFEHFFVSCVVAVAVILLLAVLCVFKRKTLRGVAAFVILTTLAVISSSYSYVEGFGNTCLLVKELEGEKHSFSGYVVKETAHTSGPLFLELTGVDGIPLKNHVTVQGFNYTGHALEEGTFVMLCAKLSLTRDRDSEYNTYLYGKGAYGILSDITDVSFDPAKDDKSLSLQVRRFIKGGLLEVLGKTSGKDSFERAYSVGTAMLYGDKDALDEDVKDDFTKSGIIHILCVSGLHFSVMLGGLSLLLKYTVKSRKARNVILALAAVLYLAVCGFTRSAVRASVMAFISAICVSGARRRYCTHVLLLAVSIICIADPKAIFDGGFHMSCICCVGIICASFVSEKLCVRLKNHPVICCIASGMLVSLSASTFLLPYSAVSFDGVSAVSALASTVVVLPAQIFLILCLVCLPFSAIMPELVRLLFASVISGLSDFMCAVARSFASLEYSYIPTDIHDASFFVFTVFIGTAACVICSKSKGAAVNIFVVGASVLATGILFTAML